MSPSSAPLATVGAEYCRTIGAPRCRSYVAPGAQRIDLLSQAARFPPELPLA
jgi:hypothetical protein